MQNLSENKTETGYAWYALTLLMFVYIMNFLDRQIIYILFPLMKTEMSFTDTELALLGGTSFAIFYTVLGIPFGRLADKKSRTKLIAIGLAIWSLFSGLTGFAGDFWTIFFCRLMVGVGEATLGPAAISLLSDYFSPKKRATITSIYSMGIAIGAGLAAFFGGYLSQFGWRQAFYIVGFPGIIFAVLVFFLRDPERTISVSQNNEIIESPKKKLFSSKSGIIIITGLFLIYGLLINYISYWGTVFVNFILKTSFYEYGFWNKVIMLILGIPVTLFVGKLVNNFYQNYKLLLTNKSFIFLCLGYGFFGLATNNISIWGAIYFSRLYEIKIPVYGFYAGVFTLAAGIPAMIFGGIIADWARRKTRGGRMFYGAILSAVSIPCWFAILFTDNFNLILPAGFVLLFAGLAWLGAAAADAVEIAGANLRGVAVAIYFFTVNIAAYLIGNNLIGKLSDSLGGTQNPQMLRYALLVCPISCLFGAIFLFIGGKSIEK